MKVLLGRRTTVNAFGALAFLVMMHFLYKESPAITSFYTLPYGDSSKEPVSSSIGAAIHVLSENIAKNNSISVSQFTMPLDRFGEGNLITSEKKDTRRILIGYSGPTEMDRGEGKNELYLRNFDFFLKHGLHCNHADFAIVLTSPVEKAYRDQLKELSQNCSHKIYSLIRERDCYDLGSAYKIFYNSTIPIQSYDYFVFVNCGMTGPSPPGHSWWQAFLNPLSDTVKMSGLSANCFRKARPHVQSMAYALDRVGVSVVLKSRSIFDCNARYPGLEGIALYNMIVKKYERGMSLSILEERYGFASIIWPAVVFWENRTNCTLTDKWGEDALRESFGGRFPYLNETIFFKSSRMLTKEIAHLIGFPETHNRNVKIVDA